MRKSNMRKSNMGKSNMGKSNMGKSKVKKSKVKKSKIRKSKISKSKISKDEAIQIAATFFSEHSMNLSGKQQELVLYSVEKSFTEPGCWVVGYELISKEGNIMEGGQFILVDEEKKARFMN